VHPGEDAVDVDVVGLWRLDDRLVVEGEVVEDVRVFPGWGSPYIRRSPSRTMWPSSNPYAAS
jgi:hypothetical protein